MFYNNNNNNTLQSVSHDNNSFRDEDNNCLDDEARIQIKIKILFNI